MNKNTILSVFILLVILAISCGGNPEKSTSKDKTETVEQVQPLDTFSFQDYNSIAYILAGRQPFDTAFLVKLTKSAEFENYKILMEKKWSDHNKNLNIIKDWSKQNISNTDTVFYPFGGPDFNYMAAFFPDCRFSVLVGLEKGGKIPFSDSLSIANYSEILKMVSQSVMTNLELSYFRTNSMARDLAGYLEGTLPIIMMFMSRHDFEIININPVFINNQGYFEYFEKDMVYAHDLIKDYEDSFEIIYKKEGEDFYRKLYYFSMDLSDEALNKKTFSLMMDNYFKNQTCFLKAASYLLDRPQFKIMKELILSNCTEIVTGPSGMPYRDFDETWDIKLFGSYIGPIRLFYDRRQEDMIEAYKNGNPEPIKFRFDYHPTNSSLIVARKK